MFNLSSEQILKSFFVTPHLLQSNCVFSNQMYKAYVWGALFLFSFLPSTLHSQTNKTLVANLGYTVHTVKEERFSSVFRDGTGFGLELAYEANQTEAINRIGLQFHNFVSGRNLPSFSDNNWLQLRYDYLRKVPQTKGLSLGGYLDAGLLFTEKQGFWNNNNLVSYTQWLSLGVSSAYAGKLGNKQWITQLNFPVLSYSIRPSYASGYPDQFQMPGTFNWLEDGIVEAGLSSGRIVSLDQFANINFSSDIFHPIGQKDWHLGLGYQLVAIITNEEKSLTLFNHGIRITLRKL